MLSAVGYASVQARVRARRSRLLDAATWSRLLEARGTSRAIEALGATPHAGIADEDPSLVERGLRRRLYLETRSLAESVPPRAGDLLTWYAGRFEVQDLKLLVRALHHGRSYDDALEALTRDVHTDPEGADWSRVRTLAGLVALLERSPYGRALELAWPRYRSERRPFYLEVALDLTFGRGLVDRIEAQQGGDREDAVALLGRWIARHNLLSAARYRSLSGVSPEEVVNFCLHRDFGGGLAMVQRIAAGAPIADEAAALGVALTPGATEAASLLELERSTDALRRAAARRRFGRAPFGLGLVLAYLIELEAEVDDLTTLLEAKTQELDGDELRRLVPREVT